MRFGGQFIEAGIGLKKGKQEMAERGKEKLNFRFERRRIRKEKIGQPICHDFIKKEYGDSCALSDKCKNATYKSEFSGTCYGGSKETEIRDRKKYLGLSE